MTRQDIIEYLDSLRKPESVDPLHKWKGNYEQTRVVFIRFFRWLYYPDVIPHNKRPKPGVIAGIGKIKRMEESIYTPTDLWTEEDDAIFYKYCPSPRDRCWHAVSRDTGCRPAELLKLKIKDVVAQQLENGYQIARITVNGKTGVRNVRLNNSYPRLKDWLSNGHPYAGNPNAPLFCGTGKKNTGKRLAPHTIHTSYVLYKKERFPKLLEDPLVPEEDKHKIRELLKKPWNPYIRRHTAATEISKSLKDSVLIDQYMGWRHSGNTRQKYQHYYTDDAFDAMLVTMDGLDLPGGSGDGKTNKKNLLKPKQCPNCNETNKPESKFCAKCKFVLSFDAFNEAVEEKEKAAKESEQTKRELAEMKARQVTYEESTNKQVEKLTQVITELIARQQDLSSDDPQDAKKLDRNVDKAINRCADYFGQDDFLKRKSPVLCLGEGKEVLETAAAATNQQAHMDTEQIKAQLEKKSKKNQVDLLLKMLSKINRDEVLSTTRTKDYIMFKLGELTNGKIGYNPNGISVELLD